MSDIYKPNDQRLNPKRKVIDLRKATEPDDDKYVCEYDDIRLIPYFDLKGDRVTRGKLFICPKCGIIKDTELDNLKHPEQLKSKGDFVEYYIHHARQQIKKKLHETDPEPGNDEMLKAAGFHVVKTRITSGDGRILRSDNYQW